MNQSTESMYKDLDFCHLQKYFEINMEKKLTDTATKTGVNAAKPASKRVAQKTAEATGDLIENEARKETTNY